MAYLTCVSRTAWSIVNVRSRLKLSIASVGLLLSQQSFAAQPSSCKPEGTLRVAQGTEMTTVDPAKSYATGADVSFLPQVFDALIMQGPDGILAPGLATSWKILDDGKRIEFELRKGVKFHNGDEFTAEDVKFSWDRISNPDTKWNPLSTVYRIQLQCIRRVIFDLRCRQIVRSVFVRTSSRRNMRRGRRV